MPFRKPNSSSGTIHTGQQRSKEYSFLEVIVYPLGQAQQTYPDREDRGRSPFADTGSEPGKLPWQGKVHVTSSSYTRIFCSWLVVGQQVLILPSDKTTSTIRHTTPRPRVHRENPRCLSQVRTSYLSLTLTTVINVVPKVPRSSVDGETPIYVEEGAVE